MATYDNHKPIIGGDFNIDLRRVGSMNGALFRRFLHLESLKCSNVIYNSNSKFTWESYDSNRSIIDHFLFCENLEMVEYDILIDGSNLSEHNSIFIKLKSFIENIREDKFKNNEDLVNWSKVTSDENKLYKKFLDIIL